MQLKELKVAKEIIGEVIELTAEGVGAVSSEPEENPVETTELFSTSDQDLSSKDLTVVFRQT